MTQGRQKTTRMQSAHAPATHKVHATNRRPVSALFGRIQAIYDILMRNPPPPSVGRTFAFDLVDGPHPPATEQNINGHKNTLKNKNTIELNSRTSSLSCNPPTPLCQTNTDKGEPFQGKRSIRKNMQTRNAPPCVCA